MSPIQVSRWPFTARIVLAHLRCVGWPKLACSGWKRWGPRTARLLSHQAPGWVRAKPLAKITLASCGTGGLLGSLRCEGAGIEVDVCVSNGGPSSRFLQRVAAALFLTLRVCLLLLKFGPLFWLYPLTYLSSSFATFWFRLLLKATESSGPTYIKLGQWASTRRDLFSEEFCTTFSKLHIQVAPHPWILTQHSLCSAFGEGWDQIIRFESQEPIGSGCVAQVYKAYVDIGALAEPLHRDLAKDAAADSASEAWLVSGIRGVFGWLWKKKQEGSSEVDGAPCSLHEDGQRGGGNWNKHPQEQMSRDPSMLSPSSKRNQLVPVAVKVLHPGLVHQVEMDLFLMKRASRFIELFPGLKWLSPTEIVEEFEKLMTQQIDLRYEARNLERFHLNFRDEDSVKFPIPLPPFVTRNILVETFEAAEPVSQYLHPEVKMELRQKLAKMGMDMLLKMVFVDNFVHADLHPGNILVQGAEQVGETLGARTSMVDLMDTLILEVQPSHAPLRLVLLDAGIIAELQSRDLENFRAVFTAVVLGQGERVAELILHHSRANQCKDVERFKAEMAELVRKARSNTIALGKLQVASLLSSVFKLLMAHKVKLESNFASVVFAIMVLEGLGRSLDPELDILKAAKPLLVKPPSSLLE
ncbi:putative aarF domain-containing protein kinase 2 isoform X2 [Paroedura picta]|uniref:putative aarF domain-containing protein kinase 2 isoform X2 n=1 Tax=Paroedura picta TaxID=143630 RepID=UPI004056D73A